MVGLKSYVASIVHEPLPEESSHDEPEGGGAVDAGTSRVPHAAPGEAEDTTAVPPQGGRQLGLPVERVFSNGGAYCGDWADGRMQGDGALRTADGRGYRGQFVNGEMHGHGEMVWPSGRRYAGQWHNDAMWGSGELSGRDGEAMRGQFKANALHGHGERVWASGDRYVGQFAEGELQGSGRLEKSGGGPVYDGTWVHGSMYGEGRVASSDGVTYFGEWLDGVPEGRGRKTWPDGSFYEGPVKQDKADGTGVKVFPDGSWFEGCFLDDNFEGHGVYRWPDGREFEGLWSVSRIAGPGCHRCPNGTTIVGTFEEGGACGEGTKRWQCGCVYTGIMLRSSVDIRGTLTWPDGRCYVGSFVEETMQGEGTLVWTAEGGVCKYSGEFEANVFEGTGVLEWSTGARYEGEFSDGLYHGHGSFRWPGGGSYTGSWDSGDMCGTGVLWSSCPQDGSSYEYSGSFRNGHMDGSGEVAFAAAGVVSFGGGQVDKYVGDFKGSRFSGQGTFQWSTGAVLKGLFEDGYCNRVGLKVYPGSRLYMGELRFDLECGKGVTREMGGREFVALWKDGEVEKELVMSCAPEFDLVALPKPGQAVQIPDRAALPPAASLTAVNEANEEEEDAQDADEPAQDADEPGDAKRQRTRFSLPEDGAAAPAADPPDRVLGRPHKALLPVVDESGSYASGKNLVVFLNGDRYIGNLAAGRKHGRGMYIYADLVTYQGVWREDVLDGVRHPVTEDDLPVEVRRLGAPPSAELASKQQKSSALQAGRLSMASPAKAQWQPGIRGGAPSLRRGGSTSGLTSGSRKSYSQSRSPLPSVAA